MIESINWQPFISDLITVRMPVGTDKSDIIALIHNVHPMLRFAFGSFNDENNILLLSQRFRFLQRLLFQQRRAAIPLCSDRPRHNIKFTILVTQLDGKYTAISDHQCFCGYANCSVNLSVFSHIDQAL